MYDEHHKDIYLCSYPPLSTPSHMPNVVKRADL